MEYDLIRTTKYTIALCLIEMRIDYRVVVSLIHSMIHSFSFFQYVEFWSKKQKLYFFRYFTSLHHGWVFHNDADFELYKRHYGKSTYNLDDPIFKEQATRLSIVAVRESVSGIPFDLTWNEKGSNIHALLNARDNLFLEMHVSPQSRKTLSSKYEFWQKLITLLDRFLNSPNS